MRILARLCAPLLLSLSCGHLAAQWHVSPTGDDAATGGAADPFLTIQHAAGVAAAGDTIHLQAGVFADEQGIVALGDKDLVLQGAGIGVTVLQPHTSLTTMLPPATVGGGAGVAHRVGVLVDGVARVHLRDLTIDGGLLAPASGHLTGLYVRGGADVVVDRCELLDCRAPTPGVGRSHAIAVVGDVATDPSTLAARRSRLAGFGDGGVFAQLRAELDLQECLLFGSGRATTDQQVGVEVVEDALLVMRSCRVAACGGATGAGVRLREPTTGCVIDANRIGGAAFGIDIEHQPPSIVPGEVVHNRIAAVDTALRIAGTSGLFVTGNSLSTVSRHDTVALFDDTAGGNAWSANRLPIGAGAAGQPFAVPGGGNVDPAPLAGISELFVDARIVCGGAPVAVVAADFDGDGREDFATLDLVGNGVGLTVALWRPGGHLVSSSAFGPAVLRPVALVVGEFDGAPGRDLVALTAPTPPNLTGAACWVFGNDGAGALALVHELTLNGLVDPCALAAAPLDADALDDLVVADRGTPLLLAGAVHAFVNVSAGLGWNASTLPGTFSGALTSVAAGDLDDDGAIDVVATEDLGVGGGLLHAWLGDGLGALAAGFGGPWTTPTAPQGATVADHDGDGDRDVLVVAFDGGLPLQRGALQIFDQQAGALVALPLLPTDAGPVRAIAADFDADAFPGAGGPDVLVVNRAAADLTLFGSFEPGAGFVDGGLVTAVDGPFDAAVTDLDLDPYRDLVVAEPGRGGVALLRGAPTARVATIGIGCPGTGGRTPRLRAGGSPGLAVQPNATLSFELFDGFPNSIAGCAIAFAPAPVLAPCQYLLDTPVLLLASFLDGAGGCSFPLPLPSSPDVRGAQLWAQAAVFDFAPNNSFLPDFSLTAALCMRVGR